MKKNPNLTSEQKLILFEEGTERPGSSELNFEKREGSYHCANCDVKLFDSKKKYESGSGWPSFFESLDSQKSRGNFSKGRKRRSSDFKQGLGHSRPRRNRRR